MEKRVKEDIVKATDSIRKKYKLLKLGLAEEEESAKKRFEPLLKPLQLLISASDGKDVEKLPGPDRKLSRKSPGKIVLRVKRPKPVARPRKISTKGSAGASREKSDDVPDYREDIFDSGGADDTIERQWHEYLAQFGPLTRKYLDGCLRDKSGHFDDKFGVRADERRKTWTMGRKEVHFDKQDNIHIDDKMFTGTTPGLFELLFKKYPDERVYNKTDLAKYKEMLEWTDAHLLESKRGYKWKKIVQPLFTTTGGKLLPLTDKKIDYVHWNDPNELVSRLALLIASREAGNYGVEGEIAAIEEELREENIIV